MKVIEIRNQKELDALPKEFKEYTIIKIKSDSKFTIKVKMARGNSSVVARENSSVEAWGNSSVVARENSSVEARENSSVVALGNSSVVARENSSVEARGNSSVEAWGNSSVVARENSSVEALGNSIIRVFNEIKKLVLKKFSVCISIGFTGKADFMSDTATIIEKPKAIYDKEEFLDIYSDNIKSDGRILLYKSTREDGTDFYTGRIEYQGIVNPEVWDPAPERQCGDGLHLSPTPELAKSYNNGIIKKCLVKKEDFAVYPHDISKVRCKEVEVIEDGE